MTIGSYLQPGGYVLSVLPSTSSYVIIIPPSTRCPKVLNRVYTSCHRLHTYNRRYIRTLLHHLLTCHTQEEEKETRCPNSRTLRNLKHRLEECREISVPQPYPIMVHDAEALVVIDGALADVVRAHEGPDGPLGVVAQDVFAEALEVGVVGVREAHVVAAGHAEAELGEDQGRGVGPALLEDEAVKEPVRVLQGAAGALGEGVRHRELVRVPLPHVLARPRAPVDVALGPDVRQVRRRLRPAHQDQHVRVRLVHARRRLPEEVVPVLPPVERPLEEEFADLVAEPHPDHARLRIGPRRHRLDAIQPVVRVEETTVGGVVASSFIPPSIPISKAA